ncbi:MAG: hypothetical protein EHM61_19795 [Acidobacteria bacterium]|nr:MAG: hypothetical protein EHM61_19795 [Acidobacteriota bacterium]
MKKSIGLSAPLLLVLILAFTAGVFAQDEQTLPQTDNQQTQTEDAQSITGELKSVDPDAKKIIVTSEGTDMEFMYDDQTVCSGAQETIEGLSTSSGSRLTVFYREDDQKQKIATRIEVLGVEAPDQTTEDTPKDPGKQPDMNEPNPPEPNRPPENPEQPLPAPPEL